MSLPTTPPRVMRGASAGTDGAAGYVIKPTAGQQAYMLRGDGTWGAQPVAGLPSQTGNSGKWLTTDGTNSSWTATLGAIASITAPLLTDLTLTGGTTGASLVLGATASGIATITTGTPTTGRLNVGAANIFVTGGSAGLWLNASGAFDVGAYEASGALRFRTGTADKMSLTSTGNLLIGTTTDAASLAGGLVVNGSGAGAAASSTTTGALRVTGGVGVSGAGYFGGTVNAVSNLNVGPVGSDFTAGRINILAASDTVPGLSFGGSNYGFGILEKLDGNLHFSRRSASATNTTWLSVSRDTGAATFAGAVSSLGFLLNRTNNSGVYTGTSDNYGFTWTGTNGEMSTATGSIIFKPAATTSLTLTSTAATFAGVVIKKNYTVATLPAAASYTYGEAYVSDATQAAGTSLGSAPTGGGSVKRGVYSDGSSWLLR